MLFDTVLAFDHVQAPHPDHRQRAHHRRRGPRGALPVRLREDPVPRARARARRCRSRHRRGGSGADVALEHDARDVRGGRPRRSRSTSPPATSTRWCCRSASRPTSTADPFTVYRALRHVNPSPYMYFIRMGELADRRLVARDAGARRRAARRDASDRRHAAARPQRRGGPAARRGAEAQREGARRARDARRSRPQRPRPRLRVRHRARAAVHGARALLARHAPGLDGRRAAGRRRAIASTRWSPCFPAGTVSGAPKIRAMEIIAELEPTRRGLYAGAVGYIDFAGNLDFCIAIRTITIARRRAPACRPAPASSPTRTRRRSTRRRATRRARCCRRSSWRRRDCEAGLMSAPADRQLRLVHLQPRPVPRRARRARRWCGATTRSRSTRSTRCAPTHIVISPGPGRPGGRGHLGRGDPPVRPDACRCSASASATRASASRSAARSSARRVLMHGKTSSVQHDGRGVFAGVSQPFAAGRYHSLIVADAAARRRSRSARDTDDGIDHGPAAPRRARCTACSSIPSRC